MTDLKDWIDCPSCDGTGAFDWGDPEDGVQIDCPKCGGDGLIPNPENTDETSERDYLSYDD